MWSTDQDGGHRQSKCASTPDHACDSGLRSPKAHAHNCCACRVLVQAPAIDGAGCCNPLPCWYTTAQGQGGRVANLPPKAPKAQALVQLLLRSWCARADLQAFRMSAYQTIPLCVLEAAERGWLAYGSFAFRCANYLRHRGQQGGRRSSSSPSSQSSWRAQASSTRPQEPSLASELSWQRHGRWCCDRSGSVECGTSAPSKDQTSFNHLYNAYI